MADQHNLLLEMKQLFPLLPDDIIKDHVLKYSLERNKCIHLLKEVQERIHHSDSDRFPPDLHSNRPAIKYEVPIPRRISYPGYVNGNQLPRANENQHSAPAAGAQFMFGKQEAGISSSRLHHEQTKNDQPYSMQRVPNLHASVLGKITHHPGVSSVPFGQPRFPHPLPEALVSRPPLRLPFTQDGYENSKFSRYPSQKQHISTLQISPGEAPFKSSQFNYYTGPSPNQPFPSQLSDANHKSSIKLQLPSNPNQELMTQIFVQTAVAQSPHHYTPTSRNKEPALFLSTSSGVVEYAKGYPRPNESHLQNKSAIVQKQEQDELAYRQALMVHQHARLDLLSKELTNKKELLQLLKTELYNQEQEVFQRLGKNSNQVVTAEENSKLCEVIRRLRVDCHCLSREVDLQNSTQVPLGVTDENFYRNIFTGQAGTVGNVVTSGALVSATATAMAVATPPQSEATSEPANGSPEMKRLEEAEGRRWRCSKCTFENHPSLSVCEICEIPRVPSISCNRSPASTYIRQQPCYCHAQH